MKLKFRISDMKELSKAYSNTSQSNTCFSGRHIIGLFLPLFLLFAPLVPAQNYPFQNTELDAEARVNDLLSRMTLDA